MKLLFSLALLICGLIVEPVSVQSVPRANAASPQVIYWPRSPNRSLNPVGLLYTPEVLANKASNASTPVSTVIREAILQQTPIVVMWTIPPNPDFAPYPRPFKTVIGEDGSGSWNPRRVEPLWVRQEATDLRQLDPETLFEEVGVMAAFPRSAFVAGRLITIYTDLPSEPGRHRGVQVFGRIEWNGEQPVTSTPGRLP
jgi:hypothetical protein